MKKQQKTAPQRAGTKDPAVGLTRLFDALGDDPAELAACLELMNRTLAARRRTRKSTRRN